MVHFIQDNEEFEQLVQTKDALLFYFSTVECSVCKILKPKVINLIEEHFPKMDFAFVEINNLPLIAAQNKVFNAPTIVVFFEGKEFIRKSRSFGLDELKSEIQRFYSRMFT